MSINKIQRGHVGLYSSSSLRPKKRARVPAICVHSWQLHWSIQSVFLFLLYIISKLMYAPTCSIVHIHSQPLPGFCLRVEYASYAPHLSSLCGAYSHVLALSRRCIRLPWLFLCEMRLRPSLLSHSLEPLIGKPLNSHHDPFATLLVRAWYGIPLTATRPKVSVYTRLPSPLISCFRLFALM